MTARKILKERRFTWFQVAPEVMVEFCKAGHSETVSVTRHGLPADALFVHARINDFDRCVEILIGSATFQPVRRGEVALVLPAPEITIRKHRR